MLFCFIFLAFITYDNVNIYERTSIEEIKPVPRKLCKEKLCIAHFFYKSYKQYKTLMICVQIFPLSFKVNKYGIKA